MKDIFAQLFSAFYHYLMRFFCLFKVKPYISFPLSFSIFPNSFIVFCIKCNQWNSNISISTYQQLSMLKVKNYYNEKIFFGSLLPKFVLCILCYAIMRCATYHFVFVAFLRRIIAPTRELSLKIFFRRSYVLGSLYWI